MPAIYDRIGGYARQRVPEPRIAAVSDAALGDARSVVNVGAGTGSYEPTDRQVQAVEPSAVMTAQRATNAAPRVEAAAESLPFDDGAFDASMAVLTIHHWTDWRAGMNEMRRVVRKRMLLFTFDVDASNLWLTRDDLPEMLALDRQIMPSLKDLASALGPFDTLAVPIPHNCVDGFLGAYWRRPEVYLDPVARRSMSSFAKIDAADGLARLARDVDSGAWRQRNAALLNLDSFDIGYRLLRWELTLNA